MFDFTFLFIQGVGALGAAGDIYATVHKNDRRFMIVIAISSLIWAVHYALLGAWSAVVSDILTSARYFGALYFRKKLIAYAFMAFYVLCIPLTYETPIDILPYFCGFISTYALFFFQGIKMRSVFIIAHLAWILYASVEGSIPGIILNAIMIIGHIRTMLAIKRDP